MLLPCRLIWLARLFESWSLSSKRTRKGSRRHFGGPPKKKARPHATQLTLISRHISFWESDPQAPQRTWLWVKNRHPKRNPGKWKHGQTSAVQFLVVYCNLDPCPHGRQQHFPCPLGNGKRAWPWLRRECGSSRYESRSAVHPFQLQGGILLFLLLFSVSRRGKLFLLGSIPLLRHTQICVPALCLGK